MRLVGLRCLTDGLIIPVIAVTVDGTRCNPLLDQEEPLTYIFMAVHYPEPGHRDDIYASMSRMAESMSGTPGLIEIGPWLDRDGDRVVGLSRWESREAFETAMPGSGVVNTLTHPGERKPREYFHLTQPDGPRPQ